MFERTTHPAIDKWAIKKFGLPADTKDVRVESQTFTRGYCETCSYEVTEVVVRDKNYKELGRTDTDLATIMREILDTAGEP